MHPYDKRLTISAAVENFTGYGQLFTEIFSDFDRRGIYCAVRALSVSEPFGTKVPLEIKSHFVSGIQPEPWELLIKPPTVNPTPGRKTIWFTMHESTRLPRASVGFLNNADQIVVPCRWNKKNFIDSGIIRPIHVIPLGFDRSIFQPGPAREAGPTVFGCAGRISHGPVRKGISRTIELFQKAFPDNKNVRLHVKVHPDCMLADVNDDRIKITKAHLEWYQLAEWFKGIHCFVSLATAEGFGLMQLQAIASGRLVMAANYGGMREFLNQKNLVKIWHKEVPDGSGTPGGMWAGMSDANVIEAFRRAETRSRNTNSFLVEETVHHLTWKKTANALYRLLVKNGAITQITPVL